MITAGCGGGEQEPAAENVAPSNMSGPTSGDAATPGESTANLDQTLAELASATAGVSWDAPEGWESQAVDGVMRRAQYRAPSPEGTADADAECVIFHFGRDGRGGDVEANIQRWSMQVLDDQGAPTEPVRVEFDLDSLHVTTVALAGTYQSGMPGGPQTPMPGWMLLGAIIEGGPDGSVFVRMTGPVAVVDTHRETWELMVRSFRIAE
jgi:hypothetical protein